MRITAKLRLISWFLSILFLVSNIAEASPGQKIPIPENKAQLRQSYQSKQHKEKIIIIEDAHASTQAQSVISDIIRIVSSVKKDLVVGIEGASGRVDLRSFTSFPNKKILNKVAEHYLRNNIISGVEHAIITNESPDFLGLEEKNIFQQDLAAFRSLNRRKQNAIDIIERLSSEYLIKVKGSGNHRLKEMISEYYSLKDSSFSEEKIFTLLSDTELEAENEIYPNIEILKELSLLSQGIDFDLCEAELKRIESELGIPDGQYNHENYQDISYLIRKADGALLTYQNAELLKYVRHFYLLNILNARALITESKRLIHSLAKHLARTESEKSLVNDLSVLQNMYAVCSLQASASEAERVLEFDKYLDSLKNIFSDSFLSENEKVFLYEYIADVHVFYSKAKKRDSIMVQQLLAESTQAEKLIVAGGFHTDGICSILRENDYSYDVISPVISGETNNANYFNKLNAGFKGSFITLHYLVADRLANVNDLLISSHIKEQIKSDLMRLAALDNLSGLDVESLVNDHEYLSEIIYALAEEIESKSELGIDDENLASIARELAGLVSYAGFNKDNISGGTIDQMSKTRVFLPKLQNLNAETREDIDYLLKVLNLRTVSEGEEAETSTILVSPEILKDERKIAVFKGGFRTILLVSLICGIIPFFAACSGSGSGSSGGEAPSKPDDPVTPPVDILPGVPDISAPGQAIIKSISEIQETGFTYTETVDYIEINPSEGGSGRLRMILSEPVFLRDKDELKFYLYNENAGIMTLDLCDGNTVVSSHMMAVPGSSDWQLLSVPLDLTADQDSLSFDSLVFRKPCSKFYLNDIFIISSDEKDYPYPDTVGNNLMDSAVIDPSQAGLEIQSDKVIAIAKDETGIEEFSYFNFSPLIEVKNDTQLVFNVYSEAGGRLPIVFKTSEGDEFYTYLDMNASFTWQSIGISLAECWLESIDKIGVGHLSDDVYISAITREDLLTVPAPPVSGKGNMLSNTNALRFQAIGIDYDVRDDHVFLSPSAGSSGEITIIPDAPVDISMSNTLRIVLYAKKPGNMFVDIQSEFYSMTYSIVDFEGDDKWQVIELPISEDGPFIDEAAKIVISGLSDDVRISCIEGDTVVSGNFPAALRRTPVKDRATSLALHYRNMGSITFHAEQGVLKKVDSRLSDRLVEPRVIDLINQAVFLEKKIEDVLEAKGYKNRFERKLDGQITFNVLDDSGELANFFRSKGIFIDSDLFNMPEKAAVFWLLLALRHEKTDHGAGEENVFAETLDDYLLFSTLSKDDDELRDMENAAERQLAWGVFENGEDILSVLQFAKTKFTEDTRDWMNDELLMKTIKTFTDIFTAVKDSENGLVMEMAKQRQITKSAINDIFKARDRLWGSRREYTKTITDIAETGKGAAILISESFYKTNFSEIFARWEHMRTFYQSLDGLNIQIVPDAEIRDAVEKYSDEFGSDRITLIGESSQKLRDLKKNNPVINTMFFESASEEELSVFGVMFDVYSIAFSMSTGKKLPEKLHQIFNSETGVLNIIEANTMLMQKVKDLMRKVYAAKELIESAA